MRWSDLYIHVFAIIAFIPREKIKRSSKFHVEIDDIQHLFSNCPLHLTYYVPNAISSFVELILTYTRMLMQEDVKKQIILGILIWFFR